MDPRHSLETHLYAANAILKAGVHLGSDDRMHIRNPENLHAKTVAAFYEREPDVVDILKAFR